MIKFFLPIILFVSFFSNFNLSASYENNEVEKTNSIIKKNKKSAYQNWDFDDENYSSITEGDGIAYTIKDPGSGINSFVSNYSNPDFNVWEMDFKFGVPVDETNKTLWSGFQLVSGTSSGYVRIRRNGSVESAIKGAVVNNTTYYYDSSNPWYHIKLIYADDYFQFFINDSLLLETYDTDGLDLTKAKPGFITWGMRYSVKNIKLSKIAITYPSDYRKLDLEFSKEISVSSCEAKNANLSYEEGQLLANVNGKNPLIELAPIKVAPGHKYSMYLPVRNTFLFRLKNKTSANKIILFFETSNNEKFQKEFFVEPNTDYLTYYFNVSDLNPTGYTRFLSFQLLDCSSGYFAIDAISFEREEPIYHYAGKIDSCLANKQDNTVTIIGEVDPKYNGKEVTIYKSDAANYNDSLSYSGLVSLDKVKINDNKFVSTFRNIIPGTRTSLIGCTFLCSVEGVKVSPYFKISNYKDFSDVKERFKIDNTLTINILDFGAKGDGFTDDNQVFQNAIDTIEKAGGGKIIVPGTTSTPYGRRYIITHLELCSNLEFEIQEGATLWQSSREEELNKTVPVHQKGYDTVTYGHDIDIDGIVWCHTFATVNKPLLYAYGKENIRVCGKGIIRMMDAGNEDDDAFSFIGGVVNPVGIDSRICQSPFGVFYTNNIDFIDFTIMRSSAWHFNLHRCNNVYFANVEEKQACSVTCDGFGLASTSNVTIERCMTYTSDDGVTLNCTVIDPRGFAIHPMYYDDKFKVENITIKSSFIFGGFGIVFIPWGTESKNEESTGIRNIEVVDCLLGGHKSSGSWPDDPYYGKSSYKTNYSTDGEDNNYVPICNVYFHKNIYLSDFDWSMGKVTPIATNFIVEDDIEGTIYSSSRFVNGNFDKNAHNGYGFEDESTWKSGLAYWTYEGNVSSIKIGTKNAEYVDTKESFIQDNYAGCIQGDGKLYQGLYELYGEYKVQGKFKSSGGKNIFFVRDALTKEELYQEEMNVGMSWSDIDFTFVLDRNTTIQVGFIHEGKQSFLLVDDVELNEQINPDIYEVQGEEKNLINARNFNIYSSQEKNVKFINDSIVTPANSEVKLLAKGIDKVDEAEINVDISGTSGNKINSGLYLFASNPTNEPDKIDAYNLQLEEKEDHTVTISLFNFSSEKGYLGKIADGGAYSTINNSIHLRVIIKNGIIFAFVNNEDSPCLSYASKSKERGMIGIRSQYQSNMFSSFKVKYSSYSNLHELEELLNKINNLDLSLYTSETVKSLKILTTEAETYSKYTSQTDVDNMVIRIQEAINNLKFKDEHIDKPDENPSKDDNKNNGCMGNISAVGNIASVLLIMGMIFFIATKKIIIKKD